MEAINFIKQTGFFLRKEVLAEWRNPFALQSTLLYVLSTVFIGYFAFRFINPETWNALFWIVMVFTGINGVSRSFILERREEMFYYYTLTGPLVVFFARLIYNICCLFFISLISFIVFMVLLGDVVGNKGYFMTLLIIASVSFGSAFTFISALASRAINNFTMASILAFPVIIPQLLLVINQSGLAISGAALADGLDEIIGLLAIGLLTIVVSYLIFPYLWRE